MPRILLIEDDQPLRDVLQELLSDEGYDIEVADGHQTGLAALAHAPFDLIMTDSIKFKPPYGALQREELEIFQQAAEQVPIVLFTGYQEAQLLNANALGFSEIWLKPMDVDRLLDAIHELLHRAP